MTVVAELTVRVGVVFVVSVDGRIIDTVDPDDPLGECGATT